MTIEIVLDSSKLSKLGVGDTLKDIGVDTIDFDSYTLSNDMPVDFSMERFWDSMWVIHDMLYTVLDMLPEEEIGITITSPTNLSLRYLVKKV